MKPSRGSDDSTLSDHQKPPSLLEILQLQPHPLPSHRGSRSSSASASHGPSPIKAEPVSLPKPVHPDFNLPGPLPNPSTGFSNPHTHALIFNPAAQARRNHVLDLYPGNQTYTEMLGQIMSCSHAISNFAEANRGMVSKQYTTQVNLARLPKEQDVNEMLRNQEIVKQLLQQVNSLQFSLRAQSGPGPPQQHMIGMSDRMTRPMTPSTELTKLDAPVGLLARCGNCTRFTARSSRQRQTLCRACYSHQTRQGAKQSSRRDQAS